MFTVLRRAGNFSMTNPAMEVLFTVVKREDKYKAKNIIETFVYRGGDQVGAWIYAGMAGDRAQSGWDLFRRRSVRPRLARVGPLAGPQTGRPGRGIDSPTSKPVISIEPRSGAATPVTFSRSNMSRATIERPQPDEHGEFYAQIHRQGARWRFDRAIGRTGRRHGQSAERTFARARRLRVWSGQVDDQTGPWPSLDAERVFGYRALRFARNDATELPGFDENSWVDNANFAQRTLADLVDEFQGVRASTIHFAKNLDAEALTRRGKASSNPFSVRALLYIIAGHERHHTALLRERYLSQ